MNNDSAPNARDAAISKALEYVKTIETYDCADVVSCTHLENGSSPAQFRVELVLQTSNSKIEEIIKRIHASGKTSHPDDITNYRRFLSERVFKPYFVAASRFDIKAIILIWIIASLVSGLRS